MKEREEETTADTVRQKVMQKSDNECLKRGTGMCETNVCIVGHLYRA